MISSRSISSSVIVRTKGCSLLRSSVGQLNARLAVATDACFELIGVCAKTESFVKFRDPVEPEVG